MKIDLHAPTRRHLLLASGTLFAWAYLPRLALAEGRDPRLLVIVLRGALDGLAAVAPVGDPDWARLRGDSGLARPGAVATGWLNRALTALVPANRANPKARDAFAVGPIAPLVVRGPASVMAWTPPRLPPTSDDTIMRLLDLYRHTDPALARVLEERLGLATIARAGGMDARPDGRSE